MFDCDIIVPQSLGELELMLARPDVRLIAGGTDLLPRLRRIPASTAVNLVDLSQLAELCFIREFDGGIEIGALTTHAAIASSELLLQYAPALANACAGIGSPQTRSRGTLGGNLANASPAADTVPPLFCLDAEVVIGGNGHRRMLPVKDFFLAPGKTSLSGVEYIHSVRFHKPAGLWGAAYLKLGRRSGMAIAVVSVSVFLELDSAGRICKARVALGSVAPVPVRSLHAEAVLQGEQPSAELFIQAAEVAMEDMNPISDVRASAEYRRHSTRVLLIRALELALQQVKGRRS